jgi:uncharacterized protein YbjQ (UPF0145 family)
MRPFFGVINFKILVFILTALAGIAAIFAGNAEAIMDGLAKGNQQAVHSMRKSAQAMHDYTPPK